MSKGGRALPIFTLDGSNDAIWPIEVAFDELTGFKKISGAFQTFLWAFRIRNRKNKKFDGAG